MKIAAHGLLAMVAALGLSVGVHSASVAAPVNVDVQLIDGNPEFMATGITYGTPGTDLAKATSGIKLSRASAPAGMVSFNVTNTSADMVHEMLVAYLPHPGEPLPYLTGERTVDEDKIDGKGEVSELDPGKSGSLTLDLQPGTYLLLCNQPGHYEAGMWTVFTVTQ